MTTTAYDIINQADNIKVIEQFFIGIASCNYYDGMCYRLYLDLDDNSIMESVEASENTWMQRDDGSLVEIARACGYCDTPADERYTDGCDLSDYGYAEWLDSLESTISDAIAK